MVVCGGAGVRKAGTIAGLDRSNQSFFFFLIGFRPTAALAPGLHLAPQAAARRRPPRELGTVRLRRRLLRATHCQQRVRPRPAARRPRCWLRVRRRLPQAAAGRRRPPARLTPAGCVCSAGCRPSRRHGLRAASARRWEAPVEARGVARLRLGPSRRRRVGWLMCSHDTLHGYGMSAARGRLFLFRFRSDEVVPRQRKARHSDNASSIADRRQP